MKRGKASESWFFSSMIKKPLSLVERKMWFYLWGGRRATLGKADYIVIKAPLRFEEPDLGDFAEIMKGVKDVTFLLVILRWECFSSRFINCLFLAGWLHQPPFYHPPITWIWNNLPNTWNNLWVTWNNLPTCLNSQSTSTHCPRDFWKITQVM